MSSKQAEDVTFGGECLIAIMGGTSRGPLWRIVIPSPSA
jgi:hypothetical protein